MVEDVCGLFFVLRERVWIASFFYAEPSLVDYEHALECRECNALRTQASPVGVWATLGSKSV